MKKKPLDYLTESDEKLRRAEEAFLGTFDYDDGLSVRRHSGKYYDAGGTMSTISSFASPIASIIDQARDTTYKDLTTQREYNNRLALEGISDNDALLAAYDNLDWGSTKKGKDFRNGTAFGDVTNSIMGGLSAGLATGNIYVGIGAAAAGLGANAYKWAKAGSDARKWNNGLSDYRSGLSRRFGQVADRVDTMNDRRLLEAFYNSAAFGGTLSTHGADWDNGLTQINAGGSHESNPNDGVPAGVDENGTPNLVEEGEVIWNNEYVFSNRLKVPQKLRNKYKLGGPISYADAVKKLTKESEERKNDPISNATNKAIVNEFIDSQEEVRAKKQQRAAERLQQAQYENELLNAIAGLGAEQALMGPVDMQMPAQEVSQEAPVIEQTGAYGGNLFEDGGNLFELGGPSGVNLSKGDIEQLKIEREAKEYAKRYLESIGEKPTERKINSIARDIAYNKSVTINPNGSVKLDYEPDRVRWKSRDNWRLEKYPIVETTDSATGASIGGTNTIDIPSGSGGGVRGGKEEPEVENPEVPNEDEIRAEQERQRKLAEQKAREEADRKKKEQEGRGNQGGGQGSGSSGKLWHDKSLTKEQGREFEHQPYYQEFLAEMANNPELADEWRQRLNKGEFGSLNGYVIPNYKDWENKATDALVGHIHNATLKAAQEWGKRQPFNHPGKIDNGLEDAFNRNVPTKATTETKGLYGERPIFPKPDIFDDINNKEEPKTPFDWRREAPIIGGLAQSLFGLFGEPDYSNADAVLEAAERVGAPVSIPVETIGDYVRRRPFDERYLVNLANQNRVAAERSAENTAGGNRAMKLGMSSVLAHNNQQELGEIMRQAYLANRQDEFSTAEFNRGTNLQNMSAINSRNLAQEQLNASLRQASLNGLISGRTMRQNIYDRDVATTGANLSNFYDNLGLRGKEAIEDNTIQSLVDNGYFTYSRDPKTGQLTFVPTDKLDLSNIKLSKNGGKLKKKRRF